MGLQTVLFTLLLKVLVTSLLINCQDPPPIVQTKYGLLEGTHDGISRNKVPFYQFRGIQYAVIKERFKPSVEPESWNGTKEAKDFGPVCYGIAAHGNENCLFINIFTPVLGTSNSTLLPVAVYIHGGSYNTGAGDDYGPNYLIDENIVFITINYRLGVLGFMSTADEASPGNYGLKDQVMALRYIQSNIHVFGGDKDKVTLMGQSAGSSSVTFHLLSPMSKGLFRHAIAQSGTFMDPWSFTHKPFRYAQKLAELLNCNDTNDTTAMVQCLREVPATVIAQRQLMRNATVKFFEEPFAAFGPTKEPLMGDGSNTFLSSNPYELLVSGNFTKVPLLSGVVMEEGIYIWAAYLLFSEAANAIEDRQKLQENFNAVAPAAFYFDERAPASRLEEISNKVQDFYFGANGFSLVDNATFSQLSRLYSDRLFVASAVRFMNLYAKHAPTYPYLYTFKKFVGIEFGWEDLHRNYSLEATHAAELDMILSPLFNQVRIDPTHDKLSKSVTKLWASFIKEGVPTATFGSERNFPDIPVDVGLQKWYKLDEDTELSENIFSGRIAFWESLQLSDDDFENCYC